MEGLVSPRTVIHILASIFILASIIIRPDREKHIWGLTVPLYGAAFVLHVLIGGFSGFALALTGAGTAFMLTYGLYHIKHITETELLISVTAGAFLGPAGFAIAYVVAFLMFAFQYIMRAEVVPTAHYFIDTLSSRGTNLLSRDERSALAEIEAQKMLRKDDLDFMNLKRQNYNRSPEHGGDCFGAPCSWPLFPWRAKLAFAVLTVLMIGLP